MRIVVLGGAGAVGAAAVAALAAADEVDEVVVADRDGARAAAVARRHGPRVSARAVDLADPGGLAAAVRGAGVVLGAAGPFLHTGVPGLEAAIAAGAAYLDVADDPEPTVRMLALDARARDAGVTAVVGLGASPGVSNLLAVLAAGELDEVDRLLTGWSVAEAAADGVGAPGGGPSAAMVHWLHGLTGTIPARRGGRDVQERPLEAVEVAWPGLGSRTVHTVGHPEPVTLPRAFPALRESVNVMALPDGLAEVLRAHTAEVDAGRASVEEAAAALTEVLEAAGGPAPAPGEDLPGVFALAEGRRAGVAARVTAALRAPLPGGLAGSTALPLAVGALLVARGALRRPGVAAPEEAVDPEAFLAMLGAHLDPPRAAGDVVDVVVAPLAPVRG